MHYKVTYCDRKLLNDHRIIPTIYRTYIEAKSSIEAARKARKELGKDVYVLSSTIHAV
jgi:hypothetical protein